MMINKGKWVGMKGWYSANINMKICKIPREVLKKAQGWEDNKKKRTNERNWTKRRIME